MNAIDQQPSPTGVLVQPDGSASFGLCGWNPCKGRGTKWVTLRPSGTGLYAEIWYELDRNKEGRVTVIPPYGWDEEKQVTKNPGHWTTLDKKLSELLLEEQASEKLMASKEWHPATMIIRRSFRHL